MLACDIGKWYAHPIINGRNIMSIQYIKNNAVPILKLQGVTKAALFGSFARGQQNKKSDIDMLVCLKKGASLFDLVELKLNLEKKFGAKVDLVTYKSLHPLLRARVLREQKVIYEKK